MQFLVLTKKSDITLFAKQCLDAKLFINRKGFKSLLRKQYKNPNLIDKLSVCISYNEIIGCATYSADLYYNISVYVKRAFRRKGIGTKLVNNLHIANPNVYAEGYREKFWTNDNICTK